MREVEIRTQERIDLEISVAPAPRLAQGTGKSAGATPN
jgi:hypothetical protein